ncbi:hypothetical protein FRC07_001478 [Ceratobasidium sp. 392]|nr:hypothetical protein FRC07_001478 [Ceratobasidium sp. 392]
MQDCSCQVHSKEATERQNTPKEVESAVPNMSLDLGDEDPDNEGPKDHIDDAQTTHDQLVVKECTKAAFFIITKCEKLVRRVHQSPEQKYMLEALVDSLASTLQTGWHALAQYILTRWNSVFKCLESHRELQDGVEMLTADTANYLCELRLSDHQWTLLDQMVQVLKIFREVTLLFWQSDQPLLHKVIPVFLRMCRRLEIVCTDKAQQLDPLVCIAAHSLLLVLEKYFELFKESEMYWIALVSLVYQETSIPKEDEVDSGGVANEDEWMLDNHTTAVPGSHALDTIEDYLSTKPVSARTVELLGGPFKYYTFAHQHQMSSDTFCAKMALKSWFNTPLLPNIEDVVHILEQGHGMELD